MRPVRFHPEAESEMIEAAAWYENQQTGLGKRFLTCVQDALNRVDLDPALYPLVDSDVRRCLTKTFPFGVLFQIKSDMLVILAVMHLHRDPGYWKNREAQL
jgi:toxin ParE1/3/4